MTAEQDSKMDQQTGMLKWILGGVAAGLIAIAGFAASTFTSFMTDRKQGETFLRDDVKSVLKEISSATSSQAKTQEAVAASTNASQSIMAKTLERQTMILEQIRDDQRKFPAVAVRPEP